jgi:predicted small lipoprotein YifL
MLATRLSIRLTTLAILLLLAGCGQKGPLYIPDKKSSAAAPVDSMSSLDAIFSDARKRQ